MLIVIDESTHEEHLSQALRNNNKQFEKTVNFLTGYNGIFNVKSKNNGFYFTRSFIDDEVTQITIPPRAYKIETLDNEINRNIIGEGHFTEDIYHFKFKPNFCTLGSTIETSSGVNGSQNGFNPKISIGVILVIKRKVIYKERNLSDYPADILSFDNFFLERDIAQRMIFRGKRSGKMHNFNMDVDLACKNIKKLRGRVQS